MVVTFHGGETETVHSPFSTRRVCPARLTRFSPAEAVPPTRIEPQTAVFPDGTTITLSPDQDPREVFADWLITPKNPWLTRSIVNRVWYWLLGRGIIHEPDDIRVYLTVLSRLSTQEERKTVAEYMRSARSKRDVASDITWALINSPEFLYRH